MPDETTNYQSASQGAQGQFHGPVTFNQGTVDAREADFSSAQGVNIAGVRIERPRRDEADN